MMLSIFSCICWPFTISSLDKCLFRSFAHFLSELLDFLLLSCMSSLYILDVNPLPDTQFANIFSHSIGCLFILLMVSFAAFIEQSIGSLSHSNQTRNKRNQNWNERSKTVTVCRHDIIHRKS